jgi:hypothetical protein
VAWDLVRCAQRPADRSRKFLAASTSLAAMITSRASGAVDQALAELHAPGQRAFMAEGACAEASGRSS